MDLLSAYDPPVLPGGGTTNYSYDADRALITLTRPDGQLVRYGYDSAGRLSSTTTPTETINYSYDSTTGNLSGASIGGGEALAYGYNGPLPTSSTLTGTVAGSVSRTYNNNFWVSSESINGGNTVQFAYDNDGLLTRAGPLAVSRDLQDLGLINRTALARAVDTRTYNAFGELSVYQAKGGSTLLYSMKLTRDADGRIAAKTELIGRRQTTYGYTYDQAGRLTGVSENGVGSSSYTYDTNSNRLSATTPSGTVMGTYDAQDRLLTYQRILHLHRQWGIIDPDR